MCTSLYIGLVGEEPHLLFGRNMDIEAHFNEAVTVTPRNYPFAFRCRSSLSEHYAIVGMAAVAEDYPLYADAMNEKGLCMAGLHFPHNAVYAPPCGFTKEEHRLAPFELIPYLLGTCATVAEVKKALGDVAISDLHFSHDLLNTPLHWHAAAADGALIIEATADGLHLYDDHVGVLTNNPPYPYHTAHLHRYDNLRADFPLVPHREGGTPLGDTYDLGLGMVGLPGDYTSPSRFVRCATLRRLTEWANLSRKGAVAQFFCVLEAVAPPVGCVKTPKGEVHATLYTCCMDTESLVYHLRRAEAPDTVSVVLTEELCLGEKLKRI